MEFVGSPTLLTMKMRIRNSILQDKIGIIEPITQLDLNSMNLKGTD